jgi:quinol monooxygenase YgiN
LEEHVIIATVRMRISPEQENDMVATIKGVLEPTRVESGCIDCRFYRDVEDSGLFILTEKWENESTLVRHIMTKRYRRLLGLMDLLEEPPIVRFHTVTLTEGLEYVAEKYESEETG